MEQTVSFVTRFREVTMGDATLARGLVESFGHSAAEASASLEAGLERGDFKLVQPVKGTARLFDPIAKWPLDVTLGPRTASNARNRVDAVVSGEGWQDDQDEYAFEYSISLKGSGSGGTVEKPGTIRLCRRPPCT